jgi:HK97 family phage portal protein
MRARREITEHPLLDLLARPNPGMSGQTLLETFYGHLQVAGNAYLEAVTMAGEVRELHVLRPDRMKVVPGKDGWPEAYEYSANGASVRFAQAAGEPVAPILHLRLFNPTDDHYGLSPLEAAAASIDIHNAAAAWNKALLDNAARPSGALVYQGAGGEANLSEDQFERLKHELEQSYQGKTNAGRPLVLEGGLDWKPLSMSPKDMEHIEAKHVAAREIALAFGVPPMLLGIPGDNTFANYAEANRTFWRQSVLPLVGRTAQALSQWLGAGFGEALQLGFDIDRIEALSQEREALWARVERAQISHRQRKARRGRLWPGAGRRPARRGGGVGLLFQARAPMGLCRLLTRWHWVLALKRVRTAIHFLKFERATWRKLWRSAGRGWRRLASAASLPAMPACSVCLTQPATW